MKYYFLLFFLLGVGKGLAQKNADSLPKLSPEMPYFSELEERILQKEALSLAQKFNQGLVEILDVARKEKTGIIQVSEGRRQYESLKNQLSNTLFTEKKRQYDVIADFYYDKKTTYDRPYSIESYLGLWHSYFLKNDSIAQFRAENYTVSKIYYEKRQKVYWLVVSYDRLFLTVVENEKLVNKMRRYQIIRVQYDPKTHNFQAKVEHLGVWNNDTETSLAKNRIPTRRILLKSFEQVGSQLKIRWQDELFFDSLRTLALKPKNEIVQVNLYKEGYFYRTLAENQPNKGELVWNIDSIANSSEYQIEIINQSNYLLSIKSAKKALSCPRCVIPPRIIEYDLCSNPSVWNNGDTVRFSCRTEGIEKVRFDLISRREKKTKKGTVLKAIESEKYEMQSPKVQKDSAVAYWVVKAPKKPHKRPYYIRVLNYTQEYHNHRQDNIAYSECTIRINPLPPPEKKRKKKK